MSVMRTLPLTPTLPVMAGRVVIPVMFPIIDTLLLLTTQGVVPCVTTTLPVMPGSCVIETLPDTPTLPVIPGMSVIRMLLGKFVTNTPGMSVMRTLPMLFVPASKVTLPAMGSQSTCKLPLVPTSVT